VSLNREQGLCVGVFVCAAGLVGYWWSGAYVKAVTPRSKTATLAAAPYAPEVSFRKASDPAYSTGARDFFVPPRDWNPLAQLAIDLPPLPEIGAIGPLPAPAPGAKALSRLRQPAILPAIARHFAPVETELDASAANADLGANAPAETPPGANGGARPPEPKESATPAASGKVAIDDAAAARRFDWIVMKGERRSYGRILNEKRLALLDDETLPIEFEVVDPTTGKVYLRNKLERDKLSGGHRVGFGFADTAANRVLLIEHQAVAEKVSPAGFLAAARECLKLREEDPRAVLAAADRLVDRSLAIDSGSVDGWVLKAELRSLAFDTEGELAVLDRARENGVEDPRLKARRARLLRKSGLLESAAALLVEVTKENVLDADALRELGHLRLEQGDSKAAVEAFDRAERLAGISPELRQAVRIDRAVALLHGGEFDAAFSAVDAVTKSDGANADAWAVRAVAQWLLGKPDAAKADFKNALEADPRHRDAVYGLGVLLGLGGDLDAAQSRLAEAEELDPLRGFDTELARGILAELGGDLDLAAAHYDRALLRHPNHPFGLYRAGRLARRLENHDEAAGLLLGSLLTFGDMTDVLNELGYVAFLADSFEDAEKYFAESLRREPDQTAVRVLLGCALARQRRLPEARAEFELAAAQDDPTALAGVAYCSYLEFDDEGAVQRLAAAAGASKDDPTSEIHRYAKSLQERIEDHRSKEQWFDVFDREQIQNEWIVNETAGPTAAIEKGVVKVVGSIRPAEADVPTELGREVDGKLFVLFESEITVGRSHNGFHGVRVWLPKNRQAAGGQVDAFAEIAIAVFPDRQVKLFVRDQDWNQISQNWVTIKELGPDYDPSKPHKFTIERTNYDTGKFVVRFDDATLELNGKSEIVVAGLRKVKTGLRCAVFGQGKARENLDFGIESVRLVRYKQS
jgi:tetratricopeptide (TPR) repeat protein